MNITLPDFADIFANRPVCLPTHECLLQNPWKCMCGSQIMGYTTLKVVTSFLFLLLLKGS